MHGKVTSGGLAAVGLVLLLSFGCGSRQDEIIAKIVGGDVDAGTWSDGRGPADYTSPDIPEVLCTRNEDCAPFYCLEEANQCVECLINSHCPKGHKCQDSECVKKQDGCTSNAECTALGLVCDKDEGKCVECLAADNCPTGEYCLDGKCLEWTCTPNASWCVESVAMQCNEDGSAVKLQKDCNDGDVCTVGDGCNSGQCKESVEKDCDDHNPCTDDACDSQDGCFVQFNDAECDDGTDCTTGDHCDNGSCVAGQLVCDCAFDVDCADLDDDDLCNGKLYCVNGYCVINPSTVVECEESPDPCLEIQCVPEAGNCVQTMAEEGTECDDQDDCTIDDQCVEGVCKGEEQVCDDGNTCTADACDPAEGCAHEPIAGECNDKNKCTWPDSCIDGVCIGETIDCEDGNPCSDNYCLPASGCVVDELVGPCEDGDLCTTGDMCVDGVCNGVEVVCADDGNYCTTDFCDPAQGCVYEFNDFPCDDGNDCTTNDHCQAGECLPEGTLFECDDSNPCTTDGCDIDTGACTYTPNSQFCDDADPCTEDDQCSGGLCLGGSQKNCDDGNVCTQDSCTSQGQCLNAPTAGACDDGNQCTTGEQCLGGVCQQGTGVKCNDANPCTDDSCQPESGCVNAPNQANCNDLDACTSGDHCEGGECVADGTMDCEDLNDCTDDSCDPAFGCLNVPNANPCDDDDGCTDGDYCAAGFCMSGKPVLCDDENLCTNDYCTAEEGCVFEPNAKECEDDNPCTFDDQCKDGACVGGELNDCDDGNPCTDDVCNYSHCQHPSLDGACDDGNACSTGDVCNNGLCLGTLVANCGCYSLALDGLSAYARVPSSAMLDLGPSFTIEAWFKLGAAGETNALFSRWEGPSAAQEKSFYLLVKSSGAVKFRMAVSDPQDGQAYNDIEGTLSTTVGWHHAAVVKSGNDLKLYLDGALSASIGATGNVAPSTAPLYIGARYNANGGGMTDMLTGWVDELRISTAAVYSGQSFEPAGWLGVGNDTAAYWGADQGQFFTLFDTSDNSLHAKLEGEAKFASDTPGDVCVPKVNYPPSTPVISVKPGVATEDDELTCEIDEESWDIESDPITYQYQWYLNGVLQPNLSTHKVPKSKTSACTPWKCETCQKWTCTVTPSDGKPGWPATASVTIGASTCKPCGGTVYGPHCYVWNSWQTNWTSAQSSCTQAGGYLVSIGDANENAAVDSLCQTACWIGLTDTAVEGAWVWESGEPYKQNQSQWKPLQPDNYYDEDCVEMCKSCGWGVSSGKWNDVDCSKLRSFVCEMEP